jgi:7,8-dihydropterin-6-yl-methyl-4-(beta-D-ribofuranosyl)aminobenzene 5'-phosphate synthase
LTAAHDDEIENIIIALEQMNVKYAGPCHCTGEKARVLFARRFADNFLKAGVGRVVLIDDLR